MVVGIAGLHGGEIGARTIQLRIDAGRRTGRIAGVLILALQRVQIRLLLHGPLAGGLRGLHLLLQSLQDTDVAVQLLRQRPVMFGLESPHFGFLVRQGLPHRSYLRVQEERRRFRLLLAGAHVLVHKE